MMVRAALLAVLCVSNILAAMLERYHTTGSSPKVLERFFCDQEHQKLLFEVQTCMDAYIAVKTIATKEAVLVHLGGGKNTWSSIITQSKIDGKMSSKRQYKKGILDCYQYKAFWLDWSVPSIATVGTGSRTGRDEILRTVHNIKEALLQASLFTLNNNKGDWKIMNDSPPVFLKPASRVAHVHVREDASLGEVIYTVEVNTDVNMTLEVIGQSKTTFNMQGFHVTLSEELDYETSRYHHVTIRAHSGHLHTDALILVHVTNVLDELPVITLSPAQSVPEELPLGEVMPRPYTVTAEAGSGLIHRLTGNHTRYLEMNAFTGELIMVGRLDYEDPSCPRVLDLTLEVEHSELLKFQVNLSLRVININDNAPRFDETIYKVKVNENDYKGKPLAVIRCDDPDLPDVENITVRIREAALADMFTILKTETTFDLMLTQGTEPRDLEEQTSLTLEARDSHTVMAKTATAIVEIEIVGFTPVWVWPETFRVNSSTIDENLLQDLLDSNQTKDLFENNQTKDLIDNNRTKDLIDNNQTKDITDNNQTKGLIDINQTKGLIDNNRTKDLTDNNRTKDLIDNNQTKGLNVNNRTKDLIDNNQTKYLIDNNQTKGLTDNNRTKDLDNNRTKDHQDDHVKGHVDDLLEIHVLEDHPPHVTIVTVNATRSNGRPSESIRYSILSIVSDTNITSMDRFTVDESLGEIKARFPLDADRRTGGVQYYVITVKASNRKLPNNYVTCQIKLYIVDVDDNPPKFSEGFYNVLSGCPSIHQEVVLLTFNVTDDDATSNVTFAITSNVSNYVRLSDDTTSLVLRSSLGAVPERWDTYEVVKVTAHDAGHPEPSSAAYVAIRYEDCSPRARRRRTKHKGVLPLPKSPPACESKTYVMDRTVEGYIFKVTSGVLGLVLVCLAAFYLSKRTVFKTSSPSVKPTSENSANPARDRRHRSKGTRELTTIGE